jgi:hypothetical protein
VAFTSAKGIDQKWCRGPENGLPRPDAVFYMERGWKIRDFGVFLYVNLDFWTFFTYKNGVLYVNSGLLGLFAYRFGFTCQNTSKTPKNT